MKYLKKNDSWVTPMDIGGGAGEGEGDWSYEMPFVAGEKN